MAEYVFVYDRTTGRKLGRRPKSWLTRFPNISETPASRSGRSPKKTAVPAPEPASVANDTAPEEENKHASS